MMTNGEHDSAWWDVMTRKIPNIDTDLELLAKSIYYRNQLEYFKELERIGEITRETYVEQLTFLGEKQGFVKRKCNS